jgi:hypothetical protein
MKRWLSIVTAACLLLYPFAAFSADYGSQSSQTQQGPPVAQPLVREGDFAIKLVAELDLGNPTDEAIAEDMLIKAGVVPSNGWLSDYPMTPEIIGQLQTSIAKAASEGRLPMNSDEATRGLYSLTQQMNLPMPAGPGNAAPEGKQPPAVQSDPTMINNYYDEQGPPIVTYYPPPYYDAYLYDWVPYPVFWFGFWFPGFYICHSFTTVVVARGGDFDHIGRRRIVSNRVIDPLTRRVAIVDPVSRTSAGSVRPMTVLRTGNGSMFRNISEMRRGYTVAGERSRPEINGASRIEGFRTPEARRSAGVIYSRSLNKRDMNRGGAVNMFRGNDRYSHVSGFSGRPVRIAPKSEYRPFGGLKAPSVGTEWRSLAPVPRQDRMFSAPLRGGEWQRPVVPSGRARSFSTPDIRGDGGWSSRRSSSGFSGRGR